jgi:hypothetical protein
LDKSIEIVPGDNDIKASALFSDNGIRAFLGGFSRTIGSPNGSP